MPALLRLVIAVVFITGVSFTVAQAQQRVAMVVGNSAYEHTTPLKNPTNDAEDMANALRGLGFEVILGLNLTKTDWDQKVREFSRALEGAQVGLFFYAGHGVQVNGVNYLVAVDAKLEAERDLDFEAIKLNFILGHMERETPLNIVFLDACRNNPLARNLARTMGTRSIGEGRGLASVASGLGTFIAYATQPENVAADGAGRNSPFTDALKRHIATPDYTINDIMIEVRKEVVKASSGSQVPWDHSSLQGRFYFNATAGEVAVQPQPQPRPLPPQAVITPPVVAPERQQRRDVCGWYTIYHCSKSESNALSEAQKFNGFVINTSDPSYPNFADGWYCGVVGPAEKEQAQAKASKAKALGFPSAYVKNPC